jgi:hypothetical protein
MVWGDPLPGQLLLGPSAASPVQGRQTLLGGCCQDREPGQDLAPSQPKRPAWVAVPGTASSEDPPGWQVDAEEPLSPP